LSSPREGSGASPLEVSRPALEYTPSLWRVSVMSRLRIVNCPMRSFGVNGAFSTFSIDRRSGAYVRFGDFVSRIE
jgi:hypothetical protein